jgi:hypothetical protein
MNVLVSALLTMIIITLVSIDAFVDDTSLAFTSPPDKMTHSEMVQALELRRPDLAEPSPLFWRRTKF